MQDLILFAAGLVVGAMNAIAGGGMLIGFPVMLATGLSPLVANATASFVVLPGQVGAIAGYRKYFKKIPRYYTLLLIPCFVGSAIGASLLKHTDPARFAKLVPLMMVIAVLLFALQPLLHFHFHRHLRGRAKTFLPILLLGLALLPISIYGGYFGVGFGFVIMAFIGFVEKKDVHKINALKNCATMAIALASITVLFDSGLIHWRQGAVMAAGTAIGAYYGARFALRFSSHAIRIAVITIGTIAAISLALRTY